MKELSLHILDIAQNSIKAEATLIQIIIDENIEENLLSIKIIDNGMGMSKEFVEKVVNPFVTTRTTRKVGLGISLFKAAAERCNGTFYIDSVLGNGTKMVANFERNHIDRAPLGNMADTMITIIMANPNIDYLYIHKINKEELVLDTKKIRRMIGDLPLDNMEIIGWMREYIAEGMKTLYENR